MDDFSRELSVAKDVAHKAGAIMRQYFRTDNQETRKDDGSPLTIADTTINRMVIRELQQEFSDRVIGEEESTGEYGMGRQWICDPIDGTKAFTWGVPTAMFSLALAIDGVPVLGVAYDPFLDCMYEGTKHNGSFCNGERLRVSNKELREGTVAITSSAEHIIRNAGCAAYLTKHSARLAAFSGSVYKACLVARGSLVGYLEGGVNAHDVAAAQVIVEEAGGMVTSLSGDTLDYTHAFKGAIFSNAVIHSQLVESAKMGL